MRLLPIGATWALLGEIP